MFKSQLPFLKGKKELKKVIKQLVDQATTWCEKNNVQLFPTIYVGSAGNFKPENPIVLPGSAINLGITPEESIILI